MSIGSADTLSIALALESNAFAGTLSDWWVLIDTPVGFYYFDAASNTWIPGVELTHQGELFDFESIEILNIAGVPAGEYTFYFGVDSLPNGQIDVDELDYSAVVVNVTETSTGGITLISPYSNLNDMKSVFPYFDDSHRGLDFATTTELKPFLASAAGVVGDVLLLQMPGNGTWTVEVNINLSETVSLLYAFETFSTSQTDGQTQLDNIWVETGQTVAQGEEIGLLYTAGAPGEGSHVHWGLFEFVPDGGDPAICPENYFTAEARLEILDLIQLDFPGAAICN